tara:strand:+ start:677 stop:988 length:312 start_codon:yes stop_codon:yes gene_type:complete
VLTPSFSFKVEDKEYSITPTFGVHDEIEKALDKTLYNACLEAEAFSISDLFKVYRILPCKSDFSEDQLKNWIALNRNEANKQIAGLVIFLLLPQKQVDAVKKN